MEKMFCYQCEQAARGIGCTDIGVCGKKPDVAHRQDMLTCEIISLASAAQARNISYCEITDLIVDSLFVTSTNVNFDKVVMAGIESKVRIERKKFRGDLVITPAELFHGEKTLTSPRSMLMFGLRGMASYAYHARVLGRRDPDVDAWFIRGLSAIAEHYTLEDWIRLLKECGAMNLKCMKLLDSANTGTYGNPIPTIVPLKIEKGPFIIITGHDFFDLKMLLEQTEGRGINVYTHGEMLPAHGYPELKKHSHLKGNFGTAWQSQQREFENVPAPILFTTSCLMPPRKSYGGRVYTTSIAAYPELRYIKSDKKGEKDFSAIIEHAIALGGYDKDVQMYGINGGTEVTTGFGRQFISDNLANVIQAIKSGDIRHIFLVGGCDGARPGRNYYTEFVKKTPKDTIVVTLACGKYRFNDIDAGRIEPFPRIIDMGQCNDAYGAIQIAMELANASKCDINDLPLTLVVSWYEQKAVCILLTMFALGMKKFFIGPSVPAFFTCSLLNDLVKVYDIYPISTPEQDLNRVLGGHPDR